MTTRIIDSSIVFDSDPEDYKKETSGDKNNITREINMEMLVKMITNKVNTLEINEINSDRGFFARISNMEIIYNGALSSKIIFSWRNK